MSSGWSRVRIFSPGGLMLDEIDVPTVRSWVLNAQSTAPGRCNFTVPIYDALSGGFNPKCTASNFQYGNLVLIEHMPSVNADGTTNGLLPPWCGLMLAPQSWEYGKLAVTAYSIEWLLNYRPLPLGSVDTNTTGMVNTILTDANNLVTNLFGGGMLVQPGAIDVSKNAGVELTFSGSAYDTLQTLARYANSDWDVTAQLSANNQLQLFLNWYAQKGINSPYVVSNNNLQSTTQLYTEQGEFYNTVLAYTDAATEGARTFTVGQNAVGFAKNGLLAKVMSFPGTAGMASSALQNVATSWLNQYAQPTKTFAPTILDVDQVFSYCVTGNTMYIQNDTVGFSQGGIGINGKIRLTAIEYSDLTNSCRLAGVLQ